ncbi:hypothetical protein [Methanolobus sp. WCC4]|uniref:hypothetical protein n=1 Tax=Methanolobus sp. WCC4 TaxID=3125784 RepID=UPI0030F9305A
MNAYFGWVQGSDMPAVYVHLSGRDVDDAVLKANGVVSHETSSVKSQDRNVGVGSDIGSDVLDALVEEKLKKMMLKLLT